MPNLDSLLKKMGFSLSKNYKKKIVHGNESDTEFRHYLYFIIIPETGDSAISWLSLFGLKIIIESKNHHTKKSTLLNPYFLAYL